MAGDPSKKRKRTTSGRPVAQPLEVLERQQNKRLGLNLAMMVAGMLMLAYASVPLYSFFCRVTGFGGTTQKAVVAPPESAILKRKMQVTFNADIDPNLAWEFKPLQNKVTVRVGEKKLIFYTAKNNSNVPLTGIATFNVTPEKAGWVFNKIQCFCFENQTLQPGQEVTMPVSFFIDPAIATDKNLDELQDITLSYTFFKAKPR
jgi:cytochrome c oxidase assembly protein subunit 11